LPVVFFIETSSRTLRVLTNQILVAIAVAATAAGTWTTITSAAATTLVAAAAAPVAAAAAARLALASFVYCDGAISQKGTIEALNGGMAALIVAHLDKSETFATPGIAVCDYRSFDNVSDLSEEIE
jgi:hypothetical protein